MRRILQLTQLAPLALLLSAFAVALPVVPSAFAQDRLKAQPIPEPPPPPPGFELDPALEPQVTILKRGEDSVEEYRISGKLYMVKVTPPMAGPTI